MLSRISPLLVVIVFATLAVWPVDAQPSLNGMDILLMLTPDYGRGSFSYEGSITGGGGADSQPRLDGWELGDAPTFHRVEYKNEDKTDIVWLFHGSALGGRLVKEADGSYSLMLGPLVLGPRDDLTIYLPYENMHQEKVRTVPESLAPEIGSPYTQKLQSIKIDGDKIGQEPFTVEISFTPIQKHIDLTLIPLTSQLYGEEQIGYRLIGEVTFAGLKDYAEFTRHCATIRGETLDYRSGHLLYILDHPPHGPKGLVADAFQFKPTWLSLGTRDVSCTYQEENKSVTARFSGRAVPQQVSKNIFPEERAAQDAPDLVTSMDYIGLGQYRLTLGEILLGPQDRLVLQVPGTNILAVDPQPALLQTRDGETRIEYNGPRRFNLRLQYNTQPALTIRQVAFLLRSKSANLEHLMQFDGSKLPWVLALLIPAAWVARPINAEYAGKQQFWRRALLLALLAVVGFFFVRGLYGWLLLAAVGAYGFRWKDGWKRVAAALRLLIARPQRQPELAALVPVCAVLMALILDYFLQRLFLLNITIDSDFTLLTPAILTLLAIWPLITLLTKKDGILFWTPERTLPFAIFFFALSMYDAYQKSLPALVLTLLWAMYLCLRYWQLPTYSREDLFHNVPSRIQKVLFDPLAQLAVAGLIAVGSILGSYDTVAIIELLPGINLAGLFLPLLIILSNLLAFTATAVLFIILYPLLPFSSGVLKAVFLSAALLSIFMLGVGGDHRLIPYLDQVLAGRFLYYLTGPLIAGITLDLRQTRGNNQASRRPNLAVEKSSKIEWKEFFDRFEKFAGILAGAASLIAPALYASVSDNPLITTYMQVLKILMGG